MGQLEDLRSFVQIVELGSIGKAAEQSGIAKSAMSRKLRLLEERMQTGLITRTTRQWSLTEAGREYYDRGISILSEFDEFEARIRHENLLISGEIRLSVPLYFGKFSLNSHLLEFAKTHPQVHLYVDFTDNLVDVVNNHFDLVVRISELQDSSLIARRLCETRHIYCASPEYLKNNGPINEPDDFRRQRIIQFGSAKRPKWSFSTTSHSDTARSSKNNKSISVPLKATMNSHDGEFLIHAAEDGQGIVRVPDFLANASLQSGRLVQLLKPYSLEPRSIHIMYPSSRYLPHRTRALMDFLLEKFNNDHGI